MSELTQAEIERRERIDYYDTMMGFRKAQKHEFDKGDIYAPFVPAPFTRRSYAMSKIGNGEE